MAIMCETPLSRVSVDQTFAVLTGFSLVSVYLLPSQSAASFSTYLLPLVVVAAGGGCWRDFAASGKLPRWMIALLLYFCASVWWSADVTARGVFSVFSRSLLILAFLIALAAAFKRVPVFARSLARALAVSGGVAALGGIVDLRLHPTWDGRLSGLGQLDNSVIAALTLNAGLICALGTVLEDVGKWRGIALACVLVIAVAVFETGSRNGYFSALVGTSVLLAVGRRRPPKPPLLWVVGLLVAAVFIGVGLFLQRPDWVQVLLPRGDSFRPEIWSAQWQRLLTGGPWLGLGILTREGVLVGGQLFRHSHSLYLASALQGGAVGLLLLVAVLACSGWRLLRNRHLEVARLGLALLATGVSAYVFDGWELIDKVGLSWLLLWVPVAIAIAVGSPSRKGNSKEMISDAISC
jgi:O-antigen ligase